MTYYGRSDQAQSNDPELLAAIRKELMDLLDILGTIQTKLFSATDLIEEGLELEELDLGQQSPLRQTRMYVNGAIQTLNNMIMDRPSDAYVQSIAARMGSKVAEDLKEKHRGG
jgi:hypothetical protein